MNRQTAGAANNPDNPRSNPMANATAFDINDKPFIQRTVSAAGAVRPATTAAASVFGIAGNATKAPRKKLPPLDLTALVIRDDVPLPERSRGNSAGGSKYAELLRTLKPGQSVVLAEGYIKALASAAKKAKVKFAIRGLDDGQMGFWRLEG